MIRIVVLSLMFATSAHAAENMPATTIIRVAASGDVKTLPDIAVVGFMVRGEGKSPDAATKALVQRQTMIESAAFKFLGGNAKITNSELSVREARGKDCESEDLPRLSAGSCAPIGYVALLDGTLRTSEVVRVGTLVGLLAREGASDPTLRRFIVRDSRAAYRRAVEAAIIEGRAQAGTIASASGRELGRLLSVADDRAESVDNEIVVTGLRALPAYVPAPPVAIDFKPAPIETRASLVMTFELKP